MIIANPVNPTMCVKKASSSGFSLQKNESCNNDANDEIFAQLWAKDEEEEKEKRSQGQRLYEQRKEMLKSTAWMNISKKRLLSSKKTTTDTNTSSTSSSSDTIKDNNKSSTKVSKSLAETISSLPSKTIETVSLIPNKTKESISDLSHFIVDLPSKTKDSISDLGQRMTHSTKPTKRVRFCNHSITSAIINLASSEKNVTKNQIYMIKPLFEYATDIWWTKSELENYRNEQMMARHHWSANRKRMGDDDKEDPLETFLHAYKNVRKQFVSICDNEQTNKTKKRSGTSSTTTASSSSSTNDDNNNTTSTTSPTKSTTSAPEDASNTTKSFDDLSKMYYNQLIHGFDHYGYYGIERYVGDDSIIRRKNSRLHVRKTVSYYKLKKSNANSSMESVQSTTSYSSGSSDDHQMSDKLSYMVRKFAESNTVQERYWARLMGHAASKTMN